MAEVFLVAVVEVDKADRIVCQAPGCGHGVFRRIHVVLVNGQFTLLGSDCFRRLYGAGKKTYTPFYHWGEGRRLTDDERQQLVQNTSDFIEQLEAERLEHEQKAIKLREVPVSPLPSPVKGKVAISRPGRLYDTYEGSPDLYEGPAVLRWQWYLDRATAEGILAAHKADFPMDRTVAAVTTSYARGDFQTPYSFALAVEFEHFLPKKYTLRLLHQLSLIVRD